MALILLFFSFLGQILITKAIRDIAAGEEVFNCYGTLKVDNKLINCYILLIPSLFYF